MRRSTHGLVLFLLLHACSSGKPLNLKSTDGGEDLGVGGRLDAATSSGGDLGGSGGAGAGVPFAEVGMQTGTGGVGIADGPWDGPVDAGPAEVGGWGVGRPLDGAANPLDSAAPKVEYFYTANPVRDIAFGPDGNLWLAEDWASIGRLTPAGVFTQFPYPVYTGSGTHIALGPDGNLWAAYETGSIARITTKGAVTQVPLPRSLSNAKNITSGPDGNIWFSYGDVRVDYIGRMTPMGEITEFTFPSTLGSLESLALGPDGSLWFSSLRSSGKDASGSSAINSFGRVSSSGDVSVVATLFSDQIAWRLTAGHDGNLWFIQHGINGLFRMTVTGDITEFPLPSTGGATPVDLARAPDGGLWFAKNYGSSKGSIGHFSAAGDVTDFPLSSSAPERILVDPDGNIWFTGSGSSPGRLTPPTGG